MEDGRAAIARWKQAVALFSTIHGPFTAE